MKLFYFWSLIIFSFIIVNYPMEEIENNSLYEKTKEDIVKTIKDKLLPYKNNINDDNINKLTQNILKHIQGKIGDITINHIKNALQSLQIEEIDFDKEYRTCDLRGLTAQNGILTWHIYQDPDKEADNIKVKYDNTKDFRQRDQEIKDKEALKTFYEEFAKNELYTYIDYYLGTIVDLLDEEIALQNTAGDLSSLLMAIEKESPLIINFISFFYSNIVVKKEEIDFKPAHTLFCEVQMLLYSESKKEKIIFAHTVALFIIFAINIAIILNKFYLQGKKWHIITLFAGVISLLTVQYFYQREQYKKNKSHVTSQMRRNIKKIKHDLTFINSAGIGNKGDINTRYIPRQQRAIIELLITNDENHRNSSISKALQTSLLCWLAIGVFYTICIEGFSQKLSTPCASLIGVVLMEVLAGN
jgi:hypothetical protein